MSAKDGTWAPGSRVLGLKEDGVGYSLDDNNKALITDARLFDRYEGEQGLSLAVEVTLQPGDKSFTDAEIASLLESKAIAVAS